ncbi:MAG TPA: metal-dependent hydrolase, partial [Cellvibrionaceae bacterium]
LVGAAMAEAGLKKVSRYATATLLIGVNLPDIDAVASFWGEDTALLIRRGWSHGVLALVLLPLVLAGAVWLWHRWRARHSADAPPLRIGMIILLSFIAVWSHPLLDWLNTYGVRLLMPFDGRWFYGDTLFIVDPWLWLLAAAGVVLARTYRAASIFAWVLLGAFSSWVILATSLATPLIKVCWVAGISAIVMVRWQRPSLRFREGFARASFACVVLYMCTAYGLARVAEANLQARYAEPLEIQANPVPGQPTAHRLVMVYDDFYRIVQADGSVIEVPRQTPDAVVEAALAAEDIRGFVNWMRYPYWEVEDAGNHWRVTIRDLRYVDPGDEPRGIGQVAVDVPKRL